MAVAAQNETAVAQTRPKEMTKIERERWAKPAGSSDDFRLFLNAASGAIRQALPRHLTPERMIRVAMTAATRNPDLLLCTAASLVAAVVQASQLGLECDGILGQAYLVPFNNKIKGKDGQKDQWRKEAQLIPGYKGLVKLARNSGELETIQDRCVFEGDEFVYAFGLEPRLSHIPKDMSEKVTHAWAAAMLRGGGKQFEVMTVKEIEHIHHKSQGYKLAKSKGWTETGPWVDDYPMMCRKTVIKRLSRLLPLSVELQSALSLDDRAEAGKLQHLPALELLPDDVRAALPDPNETEEENTTEAKPTMPKAKKQEAKPEAEQAEESEAEPKEVEEEHGNIREGRLRGYTLEQMNKQALASYHKEIHLLNSNQAEIVFKAIAGK